MNSFDSSSRPRLQLVKTHAMRLYADGQFFRVNFYASILDTRADSRRSSLRAGVCGMPDNA